MSLSSVVKKSSLPSMFLRQMEEGIRAVAEKEPKRGKKLFHISGVGYCIRQSYFKRLKETEELDTKFLRKVNFGTALHDIYQKYLAETDVLFGNWYCPVCGDVSGPCFRYQLRSGGCLEGNDHPRRKYSELTLVNPYLRVSGHPDGFVRIGGKKGSGVHLMEIKTISTFYKIGESATKVDKYVPEHKHQANFYLGVIKEPGTSTEGNGDFLISSIQDSYLLVYHDKGTDETVVYEFPFDPEMYEEDKARIKKFWHAVKTKEPPQAESSVQQCKYCSFVNECNVSKYADKL